MIRVFICTASYINNAADLCRVQWNTETARKLKRLSKRMIRVFICTARYIYNAADLYRVQWNTETARKLKALSGRMIHVYIYMHRKLYQQRSRSLWSTRNYTDGKKIKIKWCLGFWYVYVYALEAISTTQEISVEYNEIQTARKLKKKKSVWAYGTCIYMHRTLYLQRCRSM